MWWIPQKSKKAPLNVNFVVSTLSSENGTFFNAKERSYANIITGCFCLSFIECTMTIENYHVFEVLNLFDFHSVFDTHSIYNFDSCLLKFRNLVTVAATV